MRKLFCIFIISLSLLLLTSCDNRVQESTAANYLKHYASKDFEACYAMLASDSDVTISKQDYVSKLSAIFEGLQVKEVSYGNLKAEEEDGRTYCAFQMTYDTDTAEKLTNDYRMEIIKEADGSEKINWSPSLIFPQMEQGDTVRIAKIKATRGEIFSADGTLLAANVSLPCIYAVPDKITDVNATSTLLAPLLGMNVSDIASLITSKEAQRDGYVVLKSYNNLSEITDEVKEELLKISGAGIDKSNYVRIRKYPLGEAFAHTVGYVGTISDEEYQKKKDQGYAVDDIVGKDGLEQAYEQQLHGTDGYKVIVVTDSETVRATLYKKDAVNGLDLRLSIDASMQQLAYDTMKISMKPGQSGVTIVLNPKTGFVEAIANYPSYNPNDFIGGISKEKWAQLSSAEANRPMFNRSLQGLYTPGSTLKPFTAVAALDSKSITLNTEYHLTITNDKWTPEGIGWTSTPITRTSGPAHKMNLEESMIWSDNIFFAKAALDMGGDTLMKYFDKFGLGTTIPFDMNIAKPQYKDEYSDLTQALLADSAFGQGEIQITPLQMAASFAAFANGGDIMQPRIIKSIMRTDGKDYLVDQEFSPTVWREAVVSKDLLGKLLPIMEKVITQGTGQYLKATGVGRIAGKTGTAQVSGAREIGWFIGFWENEDEPRLVLTLIDGKPNDVSNKFDLARPLLSK